MKRLILILLLPAIAQAGLVGSKNSKLFHRDTCSTVSTILPANLVHYSDANSAAAMGKVPHLACDPMNWVLLVEPDTPPDANYMGGWQYCDDVNTCGCVDPNQPVCILVEVHTLGGSQPTKTYLKLWFSMFVDAYVKKYNIDPNS